MSDTTQELDEAALWAEATSGAAAAEADEAEQLESAAAAAEAAAAEDAGEKQPQAAESPQDEAAAAPPNTDPETNPPTDVWANATPEQKAAFEAALADKRQLEHRVKSDEGRVARFQRERDEAVKKIGAVKSVAEHEDLEAYLASDEWTKVKSEYGDDLKPVFTALETLAARDKVFLQRFGQIDEARTTQAVSDNLSWLNSEAPDWVELFNRDDFNPWLKSQPQGVQEMIQRNWDELVDPAEVKFIADSFRAQAYLADQRKPAATTDPQRPEIDRRREVQLDGAKSMKSRAPILTEPDPDDEDAAWAEAVAIEERKMAAARR